MKLLVIPILALNALAALRNNIDPFVRNIVVLQLAMPCGSIVAALAAKYESDYLYATESIFYTTVLSMLILPFIVFMLSVTA
jgi:predicted permease